MTEQEQLDYCKAFKVCTKNNETEEVDEFLFISVDETLNENWIKEAAHNSNLSVVSIDETQQLYVYKVNFSEPVETNDGESTVDSDIVARPTQMSVDEIYEYYENQGGKENISSIDILYQPTMLHIEEDNDDE